MATKVGARTVGNITSGERRVITLDAQLYVEGFYSDNSDDTEFVLTVNGRTVKRMNEFTARRMGIIP